MSRLSKATAQSHVRDLLQSIGGVSAIFLNNIQSNAALPPLDGPYELDNQISVVGLRVDEHVVTTSHYTVAATSLHSRDQESEIEGVPPQLAWRVEFDVMAVWGLQPDRVSELGHEALQSFALGMGVTTCHPYAREMVQDLTQKMGYPGVTLDMIMNPIHGEGDLELAPEDPA